MFDYPTAFYGINSNGIAFKLLDGTDVVIYNIAGLNFFHDGVNLVGPAQLVVREFISATPTATPTTEPNAAPTSTPTAEPTATPTSTPTSTPTATPTTEPTAAPTSTPTAERTATPTSAPTSTPTLNPTAAPSPYKHHNKKPTKEHDQDGPADEGPSRAQALSLRGVNAQA